MASVFPIQGTGLHWKFYLIRLFRMTQNLPESELVMNVFLDESGKFNNHAVVSFCGVVGSHKAFQAFGICWAHCLQNNGSNDPDRQRSVKR